MINTRHLLLITAFLLIVPGILFGEEKFGMVFDVKGTAVLKNPRKKLTLEKKRHVLYPVRDGDTLVTGKNGKLLIVSLKSKKGYELAPDSVVIIRNGHAKVLDGSVKEKEGLIPSRSKGTKVLGGQVMIARKIESQTPLPEKLAHVFYLLDSGLNEEAQREIGLLMEEYPENEYIGSLQAAGPGSAEDDMRRDLGTEIHELEKSGRVIEGEDIEE
jgi:hypothetical protein